jgi:hypothetical protein
VDVGISDGPTDTFVYDGSAQRVEQQVVARGIGVTTTTLYLGALAEYTLSSNGPTTWRDFFSFAGKLVAEYTSASGGSWHSLLADQLGTPEVQLTASGAAESEDLRGPYGAVRYGASALAGDRGYTGQGVDKACNPCSHACVVE